MMLVKKITLSEFIQEEFPCIVVGFEKKVEGQISETVDENQNSTEIKLDDKLFIDIKIKSNNNIIFYFYSNLKFEEINLSKEFNLDLSDYIIIEIPKEPGEITRFVSTLDYLVKLESLKKPNKKKKKILKKVRKKLKTFGQLTSYI